MLYQSQVLSAVDRPWVSLFEPARLLQRLQDDKSLPIANVQLLPAGGWPAEREGQWIEAEAYYRAGGPSDVRVSHGVCHGCEGLLGA